jgi:transcriptional regulator with XRE-family HTH domain
MKTLGNFIRKSREKIGLRRVDVANKSNIHLNTLYWLEHGEKDPKISTLVNVSKAINVDPCESLNNLLMDD